jgi:hypothetical protein
MKRNPASAVTLVGLLTATLICGCGTSSLPIAVSLSPSSTQTDQGLTVMISASLSNDVLNKGVTWTIAGPGSLVNSTTTSVIYTAPAPANNSTVATATVTATAVSDITKTASSQITVNPFLQIPYQSLGSGTTGSRWHPTF